MNGNGLEAAYQGHLAFQQMCHFSALQVLLITAFIHTCLLRQPIAYFQNESKLAAFFLGKK